MAQINVSQIVNAPVADVWPSWADFGNIYKFHKGLKHSHTIKDTPRSGLGAQRHCDLKDGKNWLKETIINVDMGKEIVVKVTDSSLPLKSAQATVSFKELSQKKTEVRFLFEFSLKDGILGFFMAPIIKKMNTKMLIQLLKDNARFVEKGPISR